MNKKKSVAVIVPIYKNSFTEYEEYSFYKNAKTLKERDIFLLAPKHLENYVISLSKKLRNVYVTIVDDKYFGSLRGNTRLMLSKHFYNNYTNYKYILICHFDAIVLKDDLDYWMSLKFDFIGSPLFYGNEQDSLKSLRKGGNGGFCLRNVQSHLKVLNGMKYHYSFIQFIWKNDKNWFGNIYKMCNYLYLYHYKLRFKEHIHEDTYWSEIIPDLLSWFNVADIEHSKYFAFEMNPRLLFELNNETLPMGIHAWWVYDKKFCMELMSSLD